MASNRESLANQHEELGLFLMGHAKALIESARGIRSGGQINQRALFAALAMGEAKARLDRDMADVFPAQGRSR